MKGSSGSEGQRSQCNGIRVNSVDRLRVQCSELAGFAQAVLASHQLEGMRNKRIEKLRVHTGECRITWTVAGWGFKGEGSSNECSFFRFSEIYRDDTEASNECISLVTRYQPLTSLWLTWSYIIQKSLMVMISYQLDTCVTTSLWISSILISSLHIFLDLLMCCWYYIQGCN